MKPFLTLLVALVTLDFGLSTALAQPTPVAPATQTEVDAGILHYKFVAPDTLKTRLLTIGGATNGIQQVDGSGSNTTFTGTTLLLGTNYGSVGLMSNLPVVVAGDNIVVETNAGSFTSGTRYIVSTATGTTYSRGITNTGAIFIDDVGAATPYPGSLTVTGAPTALTSISVSLINFFHRSPEDIQLVLIAPGGEQILLMAGAGGGTPGIDPTNAVTITFSDAAAIYVPSGITNGSYKPTDTNPGYTMQSPASGPYSTNLNSLIGTIPNGVWGLYAQDFVALDGGWITNWSLTIAGGSASNHYVGTFEGDGASLTNLHYVGTGLGGQIVSNSWVVTVPDGWTFLQLDNGQATIQATNFYTTADGGNSYGLRVNDTNVFITGSLTVTGGVVSLPNNIVLSNTPTKTAFRMFGKETLSLSDSNVVAETNMVAGAGAQFVGNGAGLTNYLGSNVFDVRWFGAVGDGTNNDTTAFQNAINAASAGNVLNNNRGATVIIPGGRFLLDTLTLWSGVSLEGRGRDLSELIHTNTTGNLIEGFATNSTTAEDFYSIKHLSLIQGPSIDHCTNAAIALGGIGSGRLEAKLDDLYIIGFHNGINVTNGIMGYLNDIKIMYSYRDSVTLDHCNGVSLSGVYPSYSGTQNPGGCISNNVGNGFTFVTTRYCNLVGCAADNNNGSAYYFKDAYTCGLRDCGSENNSNAVTLLNTTGFTLDNLYAYTTTNTIDVVKLDGSSGNDIRNVNISSDAGTTGIAQGYVILTTNTCVGNKLYWSGNVPAQTSGLISSTNAFATIMTSTNQQFTNLTMLGSAVVPFGQLLVKGNGTQTSPAIGNISQSTNGIYFSAGVTAIASAGVRAVDFDYSSGFGNIHGNGGLKLWGDTASAGTIVIGAFGGNANNITLDPTGSGIVDVLSDLTSSSTVTATNSLISSLFTLTGIASTTTNATAAVFWNSNNAAIFIRGTNGVDHLVTAL